MIKKILMTTALVVLIGVLVIGAVNRTLAKNDSTSVSEGQGENWRDSDPALAASEQTSVATAQGQGNGGKGHGQGAGNEGAGESAYLPQAVPGDLSADESAVLLFMREEEKLAHDVYAVFYTQWGLPVFQNISQSEQTHTESVQALLDSYGLADPASSELGVFTDPNLQALYNDLVARGSQSLAEAIKVGAAIEEIDILDLEERLAQTDNADIQQVFSNLMNGSNNHLQAFVSKLSTQTGENYQPQYLSVEAFQAIISAGVESNGNGSGVGKGQGGSSKGGGWRGGSP